MGLLFLVNTALAHSETIKVNEYTFGDFISKIIFALVFIVLSVLVIFFSKKKNQIFKK